MPRGRECVHVNQIWTPSLWTEPRALCGRAFSPQNSDLCANQNADFVVPCRIPHLPEKPQRCAHAFWFSGVSCWSCRESGRGTGFPCHATNCGVSVSGSLGWSTAVHFRHLLPRNVFCSKGFRAVLLAGIGVVAAWSTAVGQLAPAREDLKPEFGWHGHNLVGNWTEVRIPIHADTPGEYTVQVTAPDPDGHRVTFQTPAHLAAGKQTVRGYFRVGQLEPTAVELSVHEAASGKSVWSWKSTRRAADQGTAPLHSGYRLVATVGELPGFDWGDSTPQENQTASTRCAAGHASGSSGCQRAAAPCTRPPCSTVRRVPP